MKMIKKQFTMYTTIDQYGMVMTSPYNHFTPGEMLLHESTCEIEVPELSPEEIDLKQIECLELEKGAIKEEYEEKAHNIDVKIRELRSLPAPGVNDEA